MHDDLFEENPSNISTAEDFPKPIEKPKPMIGKKSTKINSKPTVIASSPLEPNPPESLSAVLSKFQQPFEIEKPKSRNLPNIAVIWLS
ncbi:hypothetical protein V9T40_006952 [Parthenolecanium corni]|uniref:Uncharacterized protein n=1 Tax=Parthenolecanium corni TaxID=536013 RepID=A0AAN9TTN3_9HEMI